MNETEKRWWVSYVVARLAPFANIFGYVYSWETAGAAAIPTALWRTRAAAVS